MASDPARARLFQEIEKDGGEASFKRLLERLVQQRPAEGQAIDGNGSPQSESGQDEADKPSFDRPRPQSSDLQFRPISSPSSIDRGLIPDDLSLNGQFVRVGAQPDGFLLERKNKHGNTIYRFKNQQSLGRFGPILKTKDNVELSNCFYPASKRDNLAGSAWQNNPELAKMTGAYMNACEGLGKHYYNGAFDISIKMRSPGNVTVFRLMPHSDGLQYIDSSNKIQKLSKDDSTVDDYIALRDDGARFEGPGDSPLTMRVEYRDGEHFFTVKTRSDYSSFKSADNTCDLPRAITEKSVGSAKCCTDAGSQYEDVKYIFVEPLRKGWFHVQFNVKFTDFSGNNDRGTPFAAFAVNNEQGVITYGTIGNNNLDSESVPLGYHAQFGIAEASDSSVFVRVKNPEFESTYRQYPQWPGWLKAAPQRINGECPYPEEK